MGSRGSRRWGGGELGAPTTDREWGLGAMGRWGENFSLSPHHPYPTGSRAERVYTPSHSLLAQQPEDNLFKFNPHKH
ncbi:hypothetical protein CEN40_25145 [Fischerella thermalis CCMEE 5205]|nr:hypothetical protein CEN40_25145 [Fischerella thermalis CCMEE 5205]